jgi:hypothetical protein
MCSPTWPEKKWGGLVIEGIRQNVKWGLMLEGDFGAILKQT